MDTGIQQAAKDSVAEALDDMAEIGVAWKRNRDIGRMPTAIREAMILAAREVLSSVDHQKATAHWIQNNA